MIKEKEVFSESLSAKLSLESDCAFQNNLDNFAIHKVNDNGEEQT